MTRIVYAQPFDPLTRAHEDVARRAAALWDELLLVVLEAQPALLPLATRVELARHLFADQPNVAVHPFAGSATEAAASFGGAALLEGLSGTSDFQAAMQQALMTHHLEAGIETIFLMTSARWNFVDSRIVREVARLGGEIAPFVPPLVAEAVAAHLAGGSLDES